MKDMDPPKVFSEILKSLAGAIFVDSGMNLESVWEILQPLFDKRISEWHKNYVILVHSHFSSLN